MTTQGIQAASNFNPDDYKLGSSEKEIKENISLFYNATNNYTDEAIKDNIVDNTEMDILYKCLAKIDNMMGNPSKAIKESFNKLKSLFIKIADAVENENYNGDNITFDGSNLTLNKNNKPKPSMEPTETDSETAANIKSEREISNIEITNIEIAAFKSKDGRTNHLIGSDGEIDLSPSNLKLMFSHVSGRQDYNHEEKVVIFTKWLHKYRNLLAKNPSAQNIALDYLQALIEKRDYDNLGQQIRNKALKGSSFFDNPDNATKYYEAVKSALETGLTLDRALAIVYPEKYGNS